MQTPWAILLCQFNDNTGEPFSREYYENLFTTTGRWTHNMVTFFANISHGNLDLSGSQVFGWFTLDHPRSDYHPSGPTFNADREQLVDWARQAATNAGNDLSPFFGVVVCMNVPTDLWGGTALDGKPVAVCDNLAMKPSLLGQEMGHGYGLAHARADGSVADYQDLWDIMSTQNAYMAPDPNYTLIGPGMNAWNMQGRGWLDESRVFTGDFNGFDTMVQLRPLFRTDLPGWLAAKVGNDFLVEFRFPEIWDAAIPAPVVLVHRFQDNQSYIMRGTQGQQGLGMGGVFQMGMQSAQFYPFVRVEVVNIDSVSELATVHLQFRPAATPPSVSPAWGDPVAYSTPADSTARVVYRGEDDHIHELYFPQGDRWYMGDLSALTGAPGAARDPFGSIIAAPFAYFTPVDSTARVVYRSTDGHIHELYLPPGSSWQHSDLSALSGAPPAASDPFGYFTPVDSTARVIYLGWDAHIHELYLPPGSGWQHGDLSALSGAPNTTGRPFGYFTPVDSTARVIYHGDDHHIHELSLPSGGNWQHGDVSAASSETTPWNVGGSRPFGYFTSVDQTARVVYRSNDAHIHELSLPPGSSWQRSDLTALSGTPPASTPPNAAGDPFGYFTPGDTTARVVYRGDDEHLHELYLSLPGGTWQNSDLSGGFAAPNAASDPYAYMGGYAYFSTFDSTARVTYRTVDNHIHQLSLPPLAIPAWQHVDLTLLAL